MHYQSQPDLHLLQVKLRRICRQLQQLLQSGKTVSVKKIQSLTKRRDRYLQMLLSAGRPLVKAGGVFAFATFFAAQTQAQECNQFNNANAANSLLVIKNPSYYANPVFVDIDNDGDLDCYTAGEGKLGFFKNVGTKEVPYFIKDIEGSGFPGYVADYAVPEFADLDGDGDYDCFIPYAAYEIKYFENVGTGSKPKFVEKEAHNPLSFMNGSYPLNLTIADIDNDGDYDVYVSTYDAGVVYKNTGTKTSPTFTRVAESKGGYNHRIYYDWNKDGLVDYFDDNGKKFYKNVGPSPADLNYVPDPAGGPDLGKMASRMYSLVDINSDGAPEAFAIKGAMYTLTPVPVIETSVGPAGITLLHATPKENGYKYQWQRNGKNIPFATVAVLPAVVPGYYTVTITDKCGTGVSLPYAYNTHAVSFEEAEAAAIPLASIKNAALPLLKTYPNPFTQQFILTLGNIDKSNTTVRITDVQGRTLSVVKATGSTLHLGATLQKGVYIVQVMQNNTVVFTQKVIKE